MDINRSSCSSQIRSSRYWCPAEAPVPRAFAAPCDFISLQSDRPSFHERRRSYVFPFRGVSSVPPRVNRWASTIFWSASFGKARSGGCGGSTFGSSGPKGNPCQCGPSGELGDLLAVGPQDHEPGARAQIVFRTDSHDHRSVQVLSLVEVPNSSISFRSSTHCTARDRLARGAYRRRSNENVAYVWDRDEDDRLRRRLT